MPAGSVALIAAGTGLGIALLPRSTAASCRAPRKAATSTSRRATPTSRRSPTALINGVRPRRSRARRFGTWAREHPHASASASMRDADPDAVVRTTCQPNLACGTRSRVSVCLRTLELFVSAYGASAGNLALTCSRPAACISAEALRHDPSGAAMAHFHEVVSRQIADGFAHFAHPGQGHPESRARDCSGPTVAVVVGSRQSQSVSRQSSVNSHSYQSRTATDD